MFSRLSIYPYKRGSASAKALSQALSTKLGRIVRRVKASGKYHPKERSRVVNWGSYEQPSWGLPRHKLLNPLVQIAVARNKIKTFEKLKGKVPIPEYSLSSVDAKRWWNDGGIVLCRKTVTGAQGAGIHIAKMEYAPIVDAPLYVKYIPKKKEFRVHVFRGKVIDIVEKRRSTTHGPVESEYIRSHANGWIFCREGIQEPSDLKFSAIASVNALGLDFGAVDIIWNEVFDKCYVLEVNTAPGIEGLTVDKYAHEICQWLN